MMVTRVGQEILKGKHLREGGVALTDWRHFTTSLLRHDIGYFRGLCNRDQPGLYDSTGKSGRGLNFHRGTLTPLWLCTMRVVAKILFPNDLTTTR